MKKRRRTHAAPFSAGVLPCTTLALRWSHTDGLSCPLHARTRPAGLPQGSRTRWSWFPSGGQTSL